MRAILSVSDKRGIEDVARRLVRLGAELYSTGGTLSVLQAAGLEARSISELTQFPEMLEGRVKTLHPAVHGGILARRDVPSDLEQLAAHSIEPVDVVVVNLYPFAEAIRTERATLDHALENIDVGGPTLIRAAAKNFRGVLVLTDPEDYSSVLDEWEAANVVGNPTRRGLAAKAFAHVSAYDSLIAAYMRGPQDLFPDTLTIGLRKVQDLRYGENPHQQAALYRELTERPEGLATTLRQHGGKELSFNNVLDANLAIQVVSDFLGPTVAIIKHGNPCGLATSDDLHEAFEHALMGDPVSAFGGVVAVNREISAEVAAEMAKTFFEVVIAPAFGEGAREVLQRKRNLRLLEVGEMRGSWELREGPATLDWKRVAGGFLAQTPDAVSPVHVDPRLVAGTQPSLEEVTSLLFAWRACEHVLSNAIVLAKGLSLVGLGAGQPSRVDSVRLAVQKAGYRAEGSVLASDAFFPFADGVEEAARAGVRAIIQPGGSVRDDEVIAAAERHGIAMLFTGTRHFRH
ncbi:MAG: bifunctional phosphoribosylaminoimidazolecarboxamide formyltransferase/IMP cyclohydrolase [Chloroflexota bacterium]|nr:bifunctional phosphoribosylaminoimidazolecarboxamide formyltransferase/IMP cyclohydrolase [Chloroflexota bacterium]